ncbi:enamine deaminase RidA (YjgF/YER057c/UK114 family) [Pseudonocardia kunmingensis]|uniref:Enamine deaminase RidA (YjgF/YER057c/UK114 family) n=1 Tax=Pseudonocardia kunmingensis TaxID=630975 RepID=A0A543DQ65_9PSEU|nr:enamine deaminase RidA (YjgF/YER057c/UK114 family) [Pseudonocardia kunmingensis]
MTWQTYSTGSSFEQAAPYSRAVYDNEWIFVSGTTGFDYRTMSVSDDIASQVRQTWTNIATALRDVGSDLHEVVQYVMIMTDPADLPVIGKVMKDVLPSRPAGTAFCASLVDPRLRYEVQVTARRGARLPAPVEQSL